TKKQAMRTNKGTWIMLIGGLVVAALVISGFLLYPRLSERWSAPLGPGLGMPTPTPLPAMVAAVQPATQAPISTEAVAEMQSEEDTLQTKPTAARPTSQPSPTPTPKPLCGGPESMTILAVGADSGPDYLYGLADVIRIVRVDFVTPKVTVLSLPRDLWVEIPEIENPYGIDHGKLNQSFFYGSPGMGYYKGPGGGPGLLARTLYKNFDLLVDHYGAVDMLTFVKIVDAVGGIDLYLPYDVDGRPIDEKTEDMGYFYAGQNHFNGDQALRFSRVRKKYNDFTRMDHQNMVICALKEKITSPSVLPKVPQIIAAFQDSVLTDLSLEQLTQLACLAPKLTRENLLFTSLPEDIMTPGRVYSPQQKDQVFVMEADFNVIKDYVAQFMAGTWPSEPNEPTCP
ncbi:MAG: LCP family protein, partial [Anaerolineales bacterium]